MSEKVRAIAFYLPQFYPTPENDRWWEPGFTEWTNVARAKPLFKGHNQPRIPRDLGFYDLRVPETREKQALLARQAGIEGFCYWHYWFGNGKRLLSDVFKEVVETGKPEYPFCLCWANHSWYAKTWDPNHPAKLLVEQTYPGTKDYIDHFMEMLPAFKDNRYMTVDGRLIFGVFDAHMIPDIKLFFDTWNRLAQENGLKGFYFFGLAQGYERYEVIKDLGYDAIVYDCLRDIAEEYKKNPITNFIIKKTIYWFHRVHKIDYAYYVDKCISIYKKNADCIPCINPDFDHSPRSSYKGIVLHGSSPVLWNKLLKSIVSLVQRKKKEKLLFIKSWNEWGEGNYLEPDRRFGDQYLKETSKVLKQM